VARATLISIRREPSANEFHRPALSYQNFIHRDDMITITTPTGGVTSGQGVMVGNLFDAPAPCPKTGGKFRVSASVAMGQEVTLRSTRRKRSTMDVSHLLANSVTSQVIGQAQVWAGCSIPSSRLAC
jgi:predicted RecA/RadA family phage recombinase